MSQRLIFFSRRKKTEIFAPVPPCRPASPEKHSIVFSIRQQIVIGPTPPGTGDDRKPGFDGRKIDIAAQFARLRVAVHPHVDHHGARRDHLRRDEFRPPDGHHQNLRPARHFSEVRVRLGPSSPWHSRRGAASSTEAHDIAAADHHGRLPAISTPAARSILRMPFGVQGSVQGCFCHSAATFRGMEAVDILLFVDGGDHLVLVVCFEEGAAGPECRPPRHRGSGP